MVLTPFEMLLLSHIVGDWLLQNAWQAENKTQGRFLNAALIVHCSLYTLSFVPSCLVLDFHRAWLLVLFWTHMVIDRRWPVVRLMQLREGSKNTMDKPPWWLVIVVDQTVHIFILAAIVVLG